MLKGYHFSVDDVLECLLRLSDWRLTPETEPVLAFCGELGARGCATDLYVFRTINALDGRIRWLDEIDARAAERLRAAPFIRFGPHAQDYGTAPHAQDPADLARVMQGIFAQIDRIADPSAHAQWVRLHYFSECYELAALFTERGVKGIFTTDKPAVTYRMGSHAAETLLQKGWITKNGIAMIRSHLRLETFAAEAADPNRFLARLDAALDTHGFVTIFTHEADLADHRVRALALKAASHLANRGIPPLAFED